MSEIEVQGRDLKLIDELLCDIRQREGISWAEMEKYSHIVSEAMWRLRQAWESNEMPVITKGLADHFTVGRLKATMSRGLTTMIGMSACWPSTIHGVYHLSKERGGPTTRLVFSRPKLVSFVAPDIVVIDGEHWFWDENTVLYEAISEV